MTVSILPYLSFDYTRLLQFEVISGVLYDWMIRVFLIRVMCSLIEVSLRLFHLNIRGVSSVIRQKNRAGTAWRPLMFLLGFIFHAVTRTFDNHRFAVMKDSVEYGACHDGVIIEDLHPFLEFTIAGDNHRSTLISL